MPTPHKKYTLEGINEWAEREFPQAFEALELDMSSRKTANVWNAHGTPQSEIQGGMLLDVGREPNNLFAAVDNRHYVYFLHQGRLDTGLTPLPLSEVGHKIHPDFLDGVFRILLNADKKRCKGRVDLLVSVLMYCFLQDGVIALFAPNAIAKLEFFKEACLVVQNWEGLPYDDDGNGNDDDMPIEELEGEGRASEKKGVVTEDNLELHRLRVEIERLRLENKTWIKDKAALERALAEERKANTDKDEKLEKRRKKLEDMSAEMKELQAEFEDYKTGAEKRIREAEEYKDRMKKKATELFELN